MFFSHLAMEVMEKWKTTVDVDCLNDLLSLTKDIVKYNMNHNAEVEACDLLAEIERIDLLIDFTGEMDYERVCLYLLR